MTALTVNPFSVALHLSHGAGSGRKVYRSSLIPGLHDVLAVFTKTV